MANKPKKETKGPGSQVVIAPPKIERAKFRIIGTAPYVQLKFSKKAKEAMKAKMEAGHRAKKGTKRPPRDFNDDYKSALHVSADGWCGMPASAFRAAMISACRLIGFAMTKAKLAVFIEADGEDADDGTPLVKIVGTPEMVMHHVRNATGVADLRVRAMWRKWSATLTVKWDGDMFSTTDVANLLARVGMQVGIGEGRPDSKQSTGMGWGLFKLEEDK